MSAPRPPVSPARPLLLSASSQHFVCAKCEKPFLGHRHYEKKGLAYCETHYNQVGPAAERRHGPVWRGCCRALSGACGKAAEWAVGALQAWGGGLMAASSGDSVVPRPQCRVLRPGRPVGLSVLSEKCAPTAQASCWD